MAAAGRPLRRAGERLPPVAALEMERATAQAELIREDMANLSRVRAHGTGDGGSDGLMAAVRQIKIAGLVKSQPLLSNLFHWISLVIRRHHQKTQ